MLDGRCNYMIPFAFSRVGHAFYGMVVALGATTGEDYLFRLRVNQCSHLLSRILVMAFHRPSRPVDARGISKEFVKKRLYCAPYPGVNRRRGIMIEIRHGLTAGAESRLET